MQDSTFSTKQKESGKTSSLQFRKAKKMSSKGFPLQKIKQQNGQTKTLLKQASLWVFLVEVPLPPLLVDLWCALRVLASAGHLLVRPVAVARPIPSSALGPTWGVHILDSEIFRKLPKKEDQLVVEPTHLENIN